MKRLVISNIKLPIDKPCDDLATKLKKEGVFCEPSQIEIIKKSLDARDKANLCYVYQVCVNGDFKTAKRLRGKCSYQELNAYKCPKSGVLEASGRHVIVGAGPAGLFAGLLLAKAGYKPLIIERGEPIEERKKTVNAFWEGSKPLNPESNVCYGEGGAGTFSDGKLTTGVKDKEGRIAYILDAFIKAGADESIRYWNKPHIGTDVLENVVRNIRLEIISLGGEFLFNTRLDDITGDNPLTLTLSKDGEKSEMRAESVILATGHSAKDIYYMLNKKQAILSSKPFAVGVRIQHPQDMIQLSQYGTLDRTHLPVADYKLTHKCEDGRGVYTFCMCPGGQVVNSSTEPDALCINGMSYAKRNGINANSAVIVTVDSNDYGDGLFDGLDFQKKLGINALSAGEGAIPIQLFGDYKKRKVSNDFGRVQPDIKGAYSFGDVRSIFPAAIGDAIEQGITAFGTQIKGFDRDDAILAGVESRTSSPIRIERDEHFESNIKGVFPCGEGAGYAGGIMSAALDGIKVAEEIIRRYKP